MGEKGYRVTGVAQRLGVSPHSLYLWVRQRHVPASQHKEQAGQSEGVRRLKAGFRRVIEERDIPRKAAACFAKQSG